MSESTDKPKILAVDDSRVIRRAMVKLLGKDYEVLEAEHGEDAWTLIVHHADIQIVFTDLSMPYLDGYGLLERIRNSDDDAIATLPVIVLTGKDDDDNAKQEALDKGADDFISKPFDAAQLKARAKTYIKLEQTTKKLSETASKLEHQATIDELTGLGSQRYFSRAADEILAYLVRHHGEGCILRMDVDGFNQLFIKHGKQVADEVIKTVGHHFQDFVRKEDMAARVGLAKFALFLNNIPLSEAKIIAQRILKTTCQLKLPNQIKITVSIGVWGIDTSEVPDIEEVLHHAEACLQHAMNSGPKQIATDGYDPQIPKEIPNLEEALEIIEVGGDDQLKPHALALYERAKPLLKMFEKFISQKKI